jgi:protein transport protein SEC24
LGNFLVKRKTTDLILCPNIDKDRVIVYELERQNESTATQEIRTLMSNQKVLYVQSALLYSTSDAQRRIRVHNIAVPLTNVGQNLHDYMDEQAMTLFYARYALKEVTTSRHNFNSVM